MKTCTLALLLALTGCGGNNEPTTTMPQPTLCNAAATPQCVGK